VQAQPGNTARDPVEDLRRDPAPERVTPVRLPTGDEIEAFVELREEAGDFTRIVLQVGVDRHDDLTLGVSEAGRERGRLAEVPAQPDDADVLLRVV
jgi:hypothetical protein